MELVNWGSGVLRHLLDPRRCAMVGDVACPKAWTLFSLNIRKQRRDPSPGFMLVLIAQRSSIVSGLTTPLPKINPLDVRSRDLCANILTSQKASELSDSIIM